MHRVSHIVEKAWRDTLTDVIANIHCSVTSYNRHATICSYINDLVSWRVSRHRNAFHTRYHFLFTVQYVYAVPVIADQSGDIDPVIELNGEHLGRGGVLQFAALHEDSGIRNKMILPRMIHVHMRVNEHPDIAEGNPMFTELCRELLPGRAAANQSLHHLRVLD